MYYYALPVVAGSGSATVTRARPRVASLHHNSKDTLMTTMYMDDDLSH